VDTLERQYFDLLKTKIVEVMQQTYAGIGRNMQDWKGQEIIDFQDDLQQKVNAYFSEKWFYNHFKNDNRKLPRIDLLNILSQYTGYTDWSAFKYKNRDKITLIIRQKGSNKIFYLLPGIALMVFIITFVVIKTGSVATYTFCFIDRDTKDAVKNTTMEVTVLYDNESPLHLECSPDGCFTYKTGDPKIKFVVQAPYYKTDTIVRILNKAARNEEISLALNDYALMINYFFHSKVADWKNRKEQLDRIIADSAYICQVFNRGMLGMELYNKKEFIDLLTIPTNSLQQIEIIEILYTKEKITTLRFILDNRQ
jgi:hypothetical protein